MATPPWVWFLVALLVLLTIAWFTNATCPTFGRSCQAQKSVAASTQQVTPEQLKIIESYF